MTVSSHIRLQLTVLALIWAGTVFCQSRFSVRGYMHDGAAQYVSVAEDSWGDYKVLGSNFSSFSQIGAPLSSYSINGNLVDSLWWTDFDDLFVCGWSGRDFSGGGVSLGYGFEDDNPVGRVIRYNILTNQVESYAFPRPPEAIQDNGRVTDAHFLEDGSIVITWSLFYQDGLEAYGLVQKFSPNGEDLVWEFLYENPNDSFAFLLEPWGDNTLIVCGKLTSIVSNPTDAEIILLDQLGEEIWRIGDEDLGMEIINGDDVLFEGDHIVLLHLNRLGTQTLFRPALTKIDTTTGSIEWTTPLINDYNAINEGKKVIPEADGEGYLVASNYLDILDETHPTEGDDNEYVRLSKVSPDGEILWERDHAYITNDNDAHRANDLKATPDGGYIMAGTVGDHETNGTGPVQQGWLLKVDEFGCLVEDCHVGINEQKPDAIQYFLVGPNPVSRAQGSLNVFLKDLPYSPNRNIEIHDLNGKLLESFNTPQGGTTYMLDVSSWAAGVVVVSFMEGGQVLGVERVILE